MDIAVRCMNVGGQVVFPFTLILVFLMKALSFVHTIRKGTTVLLQFIGSRWERKNREWALCC